MLLSFLAVLIKMTAGLGPRQCSAIFSSNLFSRSTFPHFPVACFPQCQTPRLLHPRHSLGFMDHTIFASISAFSCTPAHGGVVSAATNSCKTLRPASLCKSSRQPLSWVLNDSDVAVCWQVGNTVVAPRPIEGLHLRCCRP